MHELRIVGKDRKEAPRIDGAWCLDADKPWYVDGLPDDVTAVVKAIGPAARPLPPGGAELAFGNAVGRHDAGPLGVLRVHTGKLGEQEFDALLERVAAEAAALPFAAAAAAHPFDQAPDPGLLFHAFVTLRHALGDTITPERALRPALDAIVRRPHRRLRRQGRHTQPELARRVEPRALVDVVAGRWPLVRTSASSPLAKALHGHHPILIEEAVTDETLDTAENRFVKLALRGFRCVIDQVAIHVANRKSDWFSDRVLESCDRMTTALDPTVRHPMWDEVGPMVHFPGQSTVLHGNHAYRTVLDHHVRLQLGAMLPASPDRLEALLAVKDIALLYELWSFFAVARAVSEVLGQPSTHLRTAESPLELWVPHSVELRWAHGATLTYNATFSRNGPEGRRSYSRPLRPDLVLEVPRADGACVQHLLDAKLRIAGDGVSETTFAKSEDLHKMHTYVDAISSARSAWVLYPGSEVSYYGRRGDAAEGIEGIPPHPEGIGAIPLPVTDPGPALRWLVRRILDPPGV